MSVRAVIVPILAETAGKAARLFLATLAAIGAYVGAGLAHDASEVASEHQPTRTVKLSTRTVPIETSVTIQTPGDRRTAAPDQAPAPDQPATWGPTGRPVAQWTRPGATPVDALGRHGHH